MNENLTEIICVLDRSGSMDDVKHDSVGSFNQFINDQKKLDGEARFSLVLFNTEHENLYNGEDIQNVKELDIDTYKPSGMTALLDAVGFTVDKVGERLANTSDNKRPGKVVFVILTDGMENQSKEYTFDLVKKRIEHQKEKYNWEFLFLGAGEETIKQAAGMGIGMNKTMAFSNTSLGHKCANQSVSTAVTNLRSSGDVGDWKNNENLNDYPG